MNFIEEKIKDIETYGKSFKGRNELLNHLKGITITQRQAIAAKCYDCNGYYSDSVKECTATNCPILPYNPYNTTRIKKKTKPMSEEDKVKVSQRFKMYRNNKKK